MANGGTIVHDKKKAFILLADPGHRYRETMYSTEWVEHCIQKKELIDHNTPAYKLGHANKVDKSHFTLEEDRLLRKFVEEKKSKGAKIKGNRIYEEFATENPQHPSQSWRDRAVKILKITDDTPPYAASKVRREERLKKVQEKRSIQQIEGQVVETRQQADEARQTTGTKSRQVPKGTGGHEKGSSPVVGASLYGKEGTLEYQTQPITQGEPLSPPILIFSDIGSDEEEDRIHKQEMDALALRRSNPSSQIIKTLEDPKPGPIKVAASKEASGSDLGASQPKDPVQKSSDNSKKRRRLSFSPQRKVQHVDAPHLTKARNSRLSLPNMNGAERKLLLSEQHKEPYLADDSMESMDVNPESNSPHLEAWSAIEGQSGISQRLVSPTSTSWRNPPQSDLPMPSSLSLEAPAIKAKEVDVKEAVQSQPMTESSLETSQVELTDEDDITIERMILEKMGHSRILPFKQSSTHTTRMTAMAGSNYQNPSSNIFSTDENPEPRSNPQEQLSIGQDVPIFEGQGDEELASFHNYILPAKLLTGRSPGLSRQSSRNIDRPITALQSEDLSSGYRANALDIVTTRVENHKAFDQQEQTEMSPLNSEGDEARSSELQKSNGKLSLKARKHYDLNQSQIGLKPTLIKRRNSKEDMKYRGGEPTAATANNTSEQQPTNGGVDNDVGSTLGNSLGKDDDTGQSVMERQDLNPLADQHKRRLSTEDEEEEETLIRRKRNAQLFRPVQKSDSIDKVQRTTKRVSTGHGLELDAVQEYYAGCLGNDGGLQDANDDEESNSCERLLLYLKDLYRVEIRTLVMYELVPPLKAIDILDACSGDLKLARAFANDGITDSPSSAIAAKTTRPDYLVLRPMTIEDKAEVATLFVDTFKREPLGEYHGVGGSEGEGVAEASVIDPVSFVVEDTSLEGPHRLVAFRTSCILTAANLAAKQKKNQEEGPSDAVQAILNRMQDLWLERTTIFTTNPEAKVMKFIALGVNSRYEGLGLAKELLNAAMSKATEMKCDAIVVVASAFATQHLFQNRLKFEEMARLRYSDFTWNNEKKGGVEEKPFEKLLQPEFLVLFEKKL
ncbi:hypothetical protein BGX27_010955 [Mortierella sp. AM989]|nr:hypothetical protein BGX27_010955 [Mortierella sp. AM989]